MTFQIVTICSKVPSENYYCLNEFFKSVRRSGHEPIVLGQTPGEYKGLGDKPKLVKKAIHNKAITADHIIFCDSFDLVFAGRPEEIMESFFRFQSPFVCSSEKNCFPSDLKDKFPEAPTSYAYLNSGFIVAETDAMIAVFESMDLENVPDDYYDAVKGCNVHINDQFLYQQEFVKQPVKMLLDYRQELSNCLCNVQLDELDFSGERIKNIETGYYPLTFHMNGNAKTSGLREPILKHLNL